MPHVRRFLFDGAIMSAAQITAAIQDSARDFAAAGYGLWLIRDRDSTDPAGAAGLLLPFDPNHLTHEPDYNLGQAGTAEARPDPDRPQGFSEPPALALASRCRHSASVGPESGPASQSQGAG